MNKKDFKLSLIFTLVGLIAGGLIVSYQISIASEEFKNQLISSLGSVEMLVIVGSIQTAILSFIATFFGVKLARRLDLKLYAKLNKTNLIIVIMIGLFTALFITLSDKFIFSPYLPQKMMSYKFSFLYFFSSTLYGGIIEELLLRLFLMSFIGWILFKFFVRKKEKETIPSWIFIVSINFAAVIFALGHLPITIQTIGQAPPIIIRAILLNSVAGIGFGYLYWKIGLSHAIYAHALTHVFNQLIVMPLFF